MIHRRDVDTSGSGRIRAGMVVAITAGVTRGRRALRLLAETAREIGILMVVFAPLESVFAGRSIGDFQLLVVVALGVVAIAWGILVETQE